MRIKINIGAARIAELGHGVEVAAYLKALEESMAPQIASLDVLPDPIAELAVTLSVLDRSEMQALNNEYRNINAATDVLSFPLWEEEGAFLPPSDWESLALGDVVVCPAEIEKNASEDGGTFVRELTLVICHGVLHLLGFDHCGSEQGEQIWVIQSRMVEKFFEANPDVA